MSRQDYREHGETNIINMQEKGLVIYVYFHIDIKSNLLI